MSAVRRVWTIDGAEWISVRDAARVLGVHENTVRHWMEAGRLSYWQLPGERTFRRVGLKSVQRVLEGQQRVSERAVVQERDLDVDLLAGALERAWARWTAGGVEGPGAGADWRALAGNVIDEMGGFVTDVRGDAGASGNVTDNVSAGGEGRPGSRGYNPEGWM